MLGRVDRGVIVGFGEQQPKAPVIGDAGGLVRPRGRALGAAPLVHVLDDGLDGRLGGRCRRRCLGHVGHATAGDGRGRGHG